VSLSVLGTLISSLAVLLSTLCEQAMYELWVSCRLISHATSLSNSVSWLEVGACVAAVARRKKVTRVTAWGR
jgi:hypothetical protein